MVHIANHAPDRVFMHAGVVGWNQRALVLPGASFAGKHLHAGCRTSGERGPLIIQTSMPCWMSTATCIPMLEIYKCGVTAAEYRPR